MQTLSPKSRESIATDIPLGELVRSLATSLVEAQLELDRSAMMTAELMSGQQLIRDPKTGLPLTQNGAEGGTPLVRDSRVYFGHQLENGKPTPLKLSMLELGFTPTFYQFVETVIEVKLALRVSRSEDASGQEFYQVKGTTVDASYRSTYSYDLDAACTFRTRLVPIPAPPLLEQRIRLLLESSQEK